MPHRNRIATPTSTRRCTPLSRQLRARVSYSRQNARVAQCSSNNEGTGRKTRPLTSRQLMMRGDERTSGYLMPSFLLKRAAVFATSSLCDALNCPMTGRLLSFSFRPFAGRCSRQRTRGRAVNSIERRGRDAVEQRHRVVGDRLAASSLLDGLESRRSGGALDDRDGVAFFVHDGGVPLGCRDELEPRREQPGTWQGSSTCPT